MRTSPDPTTSPSPLPPRIPSLDGLRALAIAAVIAGHLQGTRGFPGWTAPVLANEYLGLAQLGVRIFFVISGFLITALLLEERERTGRIALWRFHVRRTARIVPAYLVYVGVIAVLAAFGQVVVLEGDFQHALTWTMNYADRNGWVLGHLWSLAVEEQFYVLWPVTLMLLGRRWAAGVAVVVVLLVPFVRVAAMMRNLPVHTFGTSADALAVGCLIALAHTRLTTSVVGRRVVAAGWLGPLLLAGMVAGTASPDHWRAQWLLLDAVANVACGLFMLYCIQHPASRTGRLLNTRPLVLLGTLSYSLYLWQQLFINRQGTAWPNAFPVNLALALLAALASYHWIERPLLALRQRWGTRALPVAVAPVAGVRVPEALVTPA